MIEKARLYDKDGNLVAQGTVDVTRHGKVMCMKRKLFRKDEQASVQLAAAVLRSVGAPTTLKNVKTAAAVIRKYRADEQKVN